MANHTTVSMAPGIKAQLELIAREVDRSQAKTIQMLCDLYHETYCPECKMKLRVRTCACKSEEQL
jgi:hypothetical protein